MGKFQSLFFFTFCFVWNNTVFSQTTFTINGLLINSSNDTLWLYASHPHSVEETDDLYPDLYTITDPNGNFNLEGKLEEGRFFSLITPQESNGWATFFIEPGKKYHVSGDYFNLSEVEVENAPERSLQLEYFKKSAPLVEGLNRSAEEDNDSNQIYSLGMEQLLFSLVNQYTDNFYSLFVLSGFRRIDKESLQGLFNSFSDRLKNHSLGKVTKYRLFDLADKIKPGNRAPEFSLANEDGHIKTLSKFKGKYVLIRFNHRRCGKCLINEWDYWEKAYKEYQPRNLEIVEISIDQNQVLWKQYLQNIPKPWVTLIDQANEEGMYYSDLFGISRTPSGIQNMLNTSEKRGANFLISPTGRILATYIHDEELLGILSGFL